MDPKISTLTIERFRLFRYLKIEGLGRVNLITGRNNTGKSSLLESLRILASYAYPFVTYDTLRSREEVEEIRDPKQPPNLRTSVPWLNLFHGFPQIFAEFDPIIISSSGRQRPMKLSLAIDRPREAPDSYTEETRFPELRVVDGAGKSTTIALDVWYLYGLGGMPPRSELVDAFGLPCVYVGPFAGDRTATLGPLWDKIALTDLEKDVVEALRIIDPGISGVSMLGGEGTRPVRTAMVRSTNLPHPVPLRSFGDGLNRLFGIVLSLVNAKDGLLLIDEFENGMHHTVQADTWRAVFKIASRLDVQVMATSHSWDAIEAFQEAASESNEEGILVRLTRKGDDIIPTVFREDELAIVTRDHIEVR